MTKEEARLLNELKAARLSIRKMKAECNQFDEGFAIGKDALRRINAVLKDYRQPVALQAPNAGVKAAAEGSPATEGSEP